RVIRDITRSNFAELPVIIKYEGAGDGDEVYGSTVTCGLNSLLWKTYSRLDNRSLCPYDDPFEEFDVRSTIDSQTRILDVKSLLKKGRIQIDTDSQKSILAEQVDVIIDLGNFPLSREFYGLSSNGVWTGSTCSDSKPLCGPPGFQEVLQNSNTTELTVQALYPQESRDRIIYRSWTATDRYSVKGNRSKVYWKLAGAIARNLRRLHESGAEALEMDSAPAVVVESGPRNSLPGNIQMLRFIPSLALRRAKLWFRNQIHKEQWILAYNFGDTPVIERDLGELNYMEPPQGKFWADPFPIQVEGDYYIFFEEFLYEAMKAHISVTKIDPSGSWSEPVKVLERDYHLSYPFLFEWEGALYMIPETKGNKAIELYRCTEFPLKWKFEKILIKDVLAVDSTLLEKDGVWWLFCNIGGKDFASNDELHIFYSDTPLGPWTPHKRNPVKSDVRSCRPAGRLFYRNGALLRPAQDCSERMGGAMCLNRVTLFDKEDYREETVLRIEPNWIKGLHGVHTLNTVGKLTMMDCFRYIRKSSI
ncbi:MAG: glucosamine inositolphosphorylceramide transferase family protein, partial [Desulfomonilaceae bacterium]